MRKTIKILFTLLLVTMLTCVFVACGEVVAEPIEDVPPPTIIGGGGGSGDGGSGDGGSGDGGSGDGGGDVVSPVDPTTGKPVYLTFSYLTQAPSVFKHIYIDEFDIANIEYHVTYECVVNGKKQYLAGEGTPLSMDMLTKESREKLENFGKNGELSGHFFLFVEHNVEYTDADGNTATKKVSGSFAVHLKTKDALLTFATLTFDLDGGYALFGDNKEGKATIKVEDGQSWTWSEFISQFPVTRDEYAIDSVTVGGKTYNASSTDTITVKGDTSFKIGWTENIMPITFDINLPEGVDTWAPTDSSVLPGFDATKGTWAFNVEKGEGFVPRPYVGNIATIDGYTFAGWRKADGTVWNFNKRAGNEAFTLYAMWTVRTYSVKYVLMGGEFATGFNEAQLVGLTRTGIDVQYANGYSPDDPRYSPDATRDNLAFKPFIVTFTGIPYGAKLSDFYGECKVRSDKNDMIAVSADPATLQGQLVKSEGCYAVDGWYTDLSYKTQYQYDTTAPVTDDLVLYPKWKLEDLGGTLIEAYYAEKLFNYTIKSDGTLRIDLIIDTSVSEIVIPDTVKLKNVTYYVSEIGEGAIMNIKTLISVDLTKAKHLTKIGRNAFAYCPNLREVLVSDEGAVAFIGEDAFRGTEFLNNYNAVNSSDFVVIGDVLVAYVGDPTVTSINIDVAGVATIAPGAFVGLESLESINLGAGVKQIHEGAFYKCANLATVTGGAGLEFVASDAFDQTKYITTSPADDPATLDVDESQYLRLGNIYYRYVGTETTTTIPAGVTIIAPNAFSIGHRVETIIFEDAGQIKSIGADAFANTKWINDDHTATETGHATTFVKDGFVVVNGILIAKRGRDAVVELPAEITTIATGAFDNQYITNVTVPADSNLALIETDAFAGASNLRALSFINATNAVFVKFNDGAFSNENGEVINDDFKIYLYEAPINTLKGAVSESDTDEIKAWKVLYGGATNMFAVLKTESARFNENLGIPTKYLYNGATVDFVAVWDALGLLNAEKTHIVDGAIVVRSDKIERCEDLEIASILNKDGSVGNDKAMTYTVDGVQSSALVYNVYPAINQSTMTVWHVVDDTEVEGFPTFYTTQSNFNEEGYVIKIKFKYNDGKNTVDEILLTDERVTITGYTPVYGVNKALQIDVDYYGLASYRLTGTYSVKKPHNVSVEQCSSMSISVNATVAEINTVARDVVLKVVASDGTFKYVSMDSKAAFISLDDAMAQNVMAEEVALDTTTLGYHTIGLRYGAPGEYVFCNIIYSVTLNTNESMFNYTIVGENEAVIAGIKSGYDTTIAIPARARLTDNGVYNPDVTKEYTIVGIGDGAFKDKTDIEYVYIPASVKTIGNEAFMGCTSLKQIRSFTVVEANDSTVPVTSVTLKEYAVKHIGDVTVSALADETRKTVRVPATVEYSKVIGTTETTPYEQNLSYVLDVKLADGVFATYNGNIELPDTDYFRAYAETHLAGKNVTFYTTGNGDKVENFVFDNYNNPNITYAYITGSAVISKHAKITVVDGVVIVPASLKAVFSVEESNYGYAYEYNYEIIGVEEEAFARAQSEGRMHTVYLPNSFSTYEGNIEDLFGAGNYNLVTQFVYDVREDAIYAPGNSFPQYVESIGNKAFYGCTSLGTVPEGTDRTQEGFYKEFGIDFGNATSLKHIGAYAFYGCSGIEEIDLSATQVTAVEASTFNGCTALRVVTLPTTVTEIGDLAYDGCSSLTTVTGTDNVKYVCAYAFHNCVSLDTIAIPADAEVADTAFDGAKING